MTVAVCFSSLSLLPLLSLFVFSVDAVLLLSFPSLPCTYLLGALGIHPMTLSFLPFLFTCIRFNLRDFGGFALFRPIPPSLDFWPQQRSALYLSSALFAVWVVLLLAISVFLAVSSSYVLLPGLPLLACASVFSSSLPRFFWQFWVAQ